MINNKYKTQMCRHWEQTGNCQLGPKCHFAHGKDDLRSLTDPLPMNSPTWQPNQAMPKPFQKANSYPSANTTGGIPSNYKTVPCKYFEKGACKYGDKCNFAHGDDDLRPGSPLKTQSSGGNFNGGMGGYPGKKGMGGMNPIISQGMMMSNQVPYQQMTTPMPQQISPTQTTRPSISDSSVQNQVANMQINYLIQQLENYHEKDPKHLAIIQEAKEILQGGNVQGAATLLNEVIQRADKTPEDTTNYNQFINNIKGLGTKIFNEIQQQQQQQQQQQYSPPVMMGMGPSMPYNQSPMQQAPVGPSYGMPMMQQGMMPQGGFPSNGYGYGGPQKFPTSPNW